MSDQEFTWNDDQEAPGSHAASSAALWVFLGLAGLMLAGFLMFALLRKPIGPPSAEVARDPLLLEGRTIYLARCVTCHGVEGRGDGPIAGSLLGPPVGNLSAGRWKHGGKSDEVRKVISQGVAGTRMSGWGQILEEPQLDAVTAYVFYLARQPIPEVLRGKAKGS